MARFSFPKPAQEVFLDHLRNGMRRGAAADACLKPGAITRRRVRDYIRDHPDFEAAVIDAEVEATEHVEEALYQAATSGSVPAAKAWLDLKGAPSAESDKAFGTPPHTPPGAGDAFDELDNVTSLDRRRK